MDLASRENDCGFDGNPDVYGLGIRLGVYCQAVALAITVCFRQTTSQRGVSYGNGIFQFAMTIGLCILSTKSDFQAVEATIVVLLALCSSIQNPFGEKIQPLSRPWTLKKVQYWTWTTGLPIFRRGIELALFLYAIWLLFVGLDRLSHSNTCKSFAFFFAPVDLYGWFRTLAKVYITGVVVVRTLLFVGWLRRVFRKRDNSSDSSDLSEIPGLIFAWAGCLFLIFFILSIELMIRWNRITSLSSLSDVGQLVAFLVGLGGLLSVFLGWERGRDGRVDGRDASEDENRSCPELQDLESQA